MDIRRSPMGFLCLIHGTLPLTLLENEEWKVIPHISDDDHEDDDEVPSQVEQTQEPPVFAASQQSEILITSGSGQSSIVCDHVPDYKTSKQELPQPLIPCVADFENAIRLK